MTDANGVSQKEAFVLLENDIPRSGRGKALRCESELLGHIPIGYYGLNETRKSVLLNMCRSIPQSRFAPLREPCYLGISGLMEFKNTLAFVGAGDFERAANNKLASRWAKQVGRRAIELSEQIRKG